jgi:catechol 2,3-dioxygenase-like lactoylglutathione lyase family enzyme
MQTLGMRHVALNVQDPQASKEFYMRVFKMDLEWEPDADNVYLTSGGRDNIALHRAKGPAEGPQRLDHIGFMLPTPAEVDAWYAWITSQNVKMVQDIKTHRDGARSFYIQDPEGIVIQMIYHPPIMAREKA